MIYLNGDGMWFRCTCSKDPIRLGTTVTGSELQALVAKHGHH